MHKSIIQLFDLAKEIDELAIEDSAVLIYLEKNDLLAPLNEIVMVGSEQGK
ncbi:MAG: hypothetical protein ABF649_12855 [Bacillus sp. (in: firmicutes)]